MSTVPLKTDSEPPGINRDLEGDPTAVVFRGDGEPLSPDVLLRQLAVVEAGIGLKPDSYSLGGNVADLESYFAEALGKESAVFMPTGT